MTVLTFSAFLEDTCIINKKNKAIDCSRLLYVSFTLRSVSTTS